MDGRMGRDGSGLDGWSLYVEQADVLESDTNREWNHSKIIFIVIVLE